MCQPMLTGLYSGWDLDSQAGRIMPRQNLIPSFEDMAMSYFQERRTESKFQSFYTTSTLNTVHCSGVAGSFSNYNTVFKALGCFYHVLPRQEVRPPLIEEGTKRGSKKKVLEEMRQNCRQEKSCTVIER